MPVDAEMMKRQRVLADFGEFALHSDNLDEVLCEACRLVGEALGTGRAKILDVSAPSRSSAHQKAVTQTLRSAAGRIPGSCS